MKKSDISDPLSLFIGKIRYNFPKSRRVYYFFFFIKFLPIFLFSHIFFFNLDTYDKNFIQKYFLLFTSNSMSFFVMNRVNIWAYYLLIYSINLIAICMCIVSYKYLKKKNKFIKLPKDGVNKRNFFSEQKTIRNLSLFIFMRYFLLSNFFYEAYFFPLICFNYSLDKIKIFFPYDNYDFVNICKNNYNIYIILSINLINFLFELFVHILLTYKFYSSNIYSSFILNFYPRLINVPFLMESFIQIMYVFIIFYDLATSNMIFLSISIVGIFVIIYRFFSKFELTTVRNKPLLHMYQYTQLICLIGFILSILFFLMEISPNNELLFVIIIMETLVILIFRRINEDKDKKLVHLFFTFNELLSEDIISNSVCEAFIYFEQISNWSKVDKTKLSEANCYLYLHYKTCVDHECVCKQIEEGLTIFQYDDFLKNNVFKDVNSHFTQTFYDKRNKDLCLKHSAILTFMKRLIIYRLSLLQKGKLENEIKEFLLINQMSFQVKNNNSFFYPFLTITDFYVLNESVNSITNKQLLKEQSKKNMNYFIYFKRYLKYRYKEYLLNVTKKKLLNKEKESAKDNGYHDTYNLFKLYDLHNEIEKEIVNSTIQYGSLLDCFLKKELNTNHFNICLKKFREKHKYLAHIIKKIRKYELMKGIFLNVKIKLYFRLLNFDPPWQMNDYSSLVYSINNLSDITDEQVIIINYENQNFIIKNISHELIIMLDYTENELINKDLNVLLPSEMRNLHKSLIFKEIKEKDLLSNNISKEIFLMSKTSYCYLFQFRYKFSFNLRGEMSIFCFLTNKEYIPEKNYSIGFVCLEEKSGSAICINNEFEENCRMNLELLADINYDSKKMLFQNNIENIRDYFKKPFNYLHEYEYLFDFDQYKTEVNQLDFTEPIEKGLITMKNNNKISTNFNYTLNNSSAKRVVGKFSKKSWYFALANNFLNKYNHREMGILNNHLKATVNLRTLGPNRFYFIKIYFKTFSFNLLDDLGGKNSTKSIYNKKDTKETKNFFKKTYFSTSNVRDIHLSKKSLVESFKRKSSNKIVIDQNGSQEFVGEKLIHSIKLTKIQNFYTYFFIIFLLLITSISYNIFSIIYKEYTLNENLDFFMFDYYSSKLKSRFLLLISPLVSLSLSKGNFDSNISNSSYTRFSDYYANVMGNSSVDYINIFSNFDGFLSDFSEKYNSLHSIPTNISNFHYIFDDYSTFDLINNDFDELSNFHIKTKLIYYEYYSKDGLNISLNNLYYQTNSYFNKTREYLSNSDQDFYFITTNYFNNFNLFFLDSFELIKEIFFNSIESNTKSCIIVNSAEVLVIMISIISQYLLLRNSYFKIKNKIIEISIFFIINLKERHEKYKSFLNFLQNYDIHSYSVVIRDLDSSEIKNQKEEDYFTPSNKISSKNTIFIPKTSVNFKLPSNDDNCKVIESNNQVKPSLRSLRFFNKLSKNNKNRLPKPAEEDVNYQETLEALNEDNSSVVDTDKFQENHNNETNFDINNQINEKDCKKENFIETSRLNVRESFGTENSFIIVDRMLSEHRYGIFTLFTFSSFFLGFYIFLLFFDYTAYEKIRKVNKISTNLELLIPSFFEIMLVYRINLLQNSTNFSDIYSYNNTFQNLYNEFSNILYDHKTQDLSYSSLLINNLSTDKMCEYLADYVTIYNLDRNTMFVDCYNSPKGINSKGLINSLKTVKTIIDSLLVELVYLNRTKENLITKLKDPDLGQVIYELEFIYRNVHLVLSESIEKDIKYIFDDIIFKERIFSVVIIIFNIVFLIFSVRFIIQPIKIINEKFLWILKKIYRK